MPGFDSGNILFIVRDTRMKPCRGRQGKMWNKMVEDISIIIIILILFLCIKIKFVS